MKIHSSCEIEDFVETHLCKLIIVSPNRLLYFHVMAIDDNDVTAVTNMTYVSRRTQVLLVCVCIESRVISKQLTLQTDWLCSIAAFLSLLA